MTKSETARPGNGQKLLLVEDNKDLRESYSLIIELLNFRPVLAMNAEEALSVLESDHEISLIMTDVVMPGAMSGMDLLSWVKESRPTLPVILMSGYPANEVEFRDRLRVTDRYLTKPFKIDDLSALMKELMHGVDRTGPAS